MRLNSNNSHILSAKGIEIKIIYFVAYLLKIIFLQP